MKNIARTFLLAAAATVSLSAQSLIQGPSSSQSSYLTPTAPGWSATAIMTVGDRVGHVIHRKVAFAVFGTSAMAWFYLSPQRSHLGALFVTRLKPSREPRHD